MPTLLREPTVTLNKYDLAFLAWFERWGWQIHSYAGKIDVWTNDDARCPFKVTRPMIDRLEWAGKIERIFPQHAAVLDYVWVLSPNK
jgi:hypothetical protein